MTNMDQSDREGPLSATLSAADERAQEAYEAAEDARREFATMSERFQREAAALAKQHEITTEDASDLAPIFWEKFLDYFDLPTPDEAADRARAAE